MTVHEFARYLGQQIAAGRGHFRMCVFLPQVDGGEGYTDILDTEENDPAERIDIYLRS